MAQEKNCGNCNGNDAGLCYQCPDSPDEPIIIEDESHTCNGWKPA